jgi:hypothetical protein
VIIMRVVFISAALAASFAFAADPPQHRGPPQEALTACSGLSEGSACGFTFNGKNLTGNCRKSPGGEAAACFPEGGPGGRHHGPPPEAIAACSGKTEGTQSKTFSQYMGGLQKYVPMAMAFFAPNVNSYRRLALGQVAPINVQWGYDNRTCGLRVPMDTPENMRVESRFAGSDANPYLAMAGTLACGLLGIQEKLKPTAPLASSAQDVGFELPRSLGEALDELETCEPLKALMGPRFVRAYVSVKRKEYETFFRVISSWEREFLLLNV